MVARKSSNLKKLQDANEEYRVKLVNDALLLLHKEKAVYPDITSLAKRVALMVALVEKMSGKLRTINYTTLLRKTRDGLPGPYRLQLEMYQSGRFDPSNMNRELTVKEMEAFIAKNPALRMYIAKKDLEISTLKVQLEEQKRGLRRVGAYLENQGQDVQQIAANAGRQQLNELEQAKRDFTMTCTWIYKFLRVVDWIKIDEDNEVILNLAALGKPPVAEKSLLAPFFRALKVRRQGEGQDE